MKRLPSFACALAASLVAGAAHAGQIHDTGTGAYWGSNGRGAGDVIGGSAYDVDGATITRVGSTLTISIATNFAGHAGALATMGPGGIGYGDVFLAQSWNPFGSDRQHGADNAANGTHWSYGFNLDDRWSNTGGTFKLYALNGATNAKNILNSQSFMKCKLGKNCDYRAGQATAVKTSSASVRDTGMTGTWSVLADQELRFTIDALPADLLNYASYAMHWGETCQNDVIEGVVHDLAPVQPMPEPVPEPVQVPVPLPGSASLLALGLGALAAARRRTAPPASRAG